MKNKLTLFIFILLFSFSNYVSAEQNYMCRYNGRTGTWNTSDKSLVCEHLDKNSSTYKSCKFNQEWYKWGLEAYKAGKCEPIPVRNK